MDPTSLGIVMAAVGVAILATGIYVFRKVRKGGRSGPAGGGRGEYNPTKKRIRG